MLVFRHYKQLLLRPRLALVLGYLAGIIIGCDLWQPLALEAVTPAVVERGKQATALVVIGNREEFGSAFCIASSGFFVTNQHVVANAGNDKVTLVVNAGEAGQKVITAKVLEVDKEADLALLQAAAPGPFTALPLGSVQGLVETQPVAAFGYPFGPDLAMSRADYPNITVSTGRITALRRTQGELGVIQVDASLNPGNSGGPLVDDQGRVIGMVAAGIPGAALNFAIPISHLAQFLARPQIIFSPAPIAFGQASQEHDFTIKVVFFAQSSQPPAQPPVVTLSLSAGVGDGRFYTARSVGNDAYVVRAAPVATRQGPHLLQVTAKSAEGSLVGRVADRSIHVNGTALKLSAIQSIEQTNGAQAGGVRVVLNDGQTLNGKISGLETVETKIGAVAASMNLNKFESLSISDTEVPATEVKYRIVVRQAGAVVGSAMGDIPIVAAPLPATSSPLAPGVSTSPPLPAPGGAGGVVSTAIPNITPPLLTQEVQSIKLPAAAEDVAVGGGGRYLILWLKRLHKLAIFDVSAAKVTHFLPVEADDIVFAAGAQKLIVIINDQNIVQRWDLVTFERELTIPTPDGARFQSIAIGSATAGPALLAGTDLKVSFLDLTTLKPMDVEIKEQPWVGGHAFTRFQVRAARDGSVFTGWVPGSSIHGTYTIALHGKTAQTQFHRQWTAHALPAPDGSLIYTDRGLLTPEMVSVVPERFDLMATLPLLDSSSYFVGFARTGDWGSPHLKMPPGLYSATDKRLLVTLPDLPEIALPERPRWNASPPAFETLDKELHVIANAKLIITIAQTKDELLLRHFDLIEAMNKAGIDYLFVNSAPPSTATRGRLYIYQLDVKSKRGGVNYTLDSGPPGMTLSRAGRLEWLVPPNYTGSQENIIISIRDASGQELFHSFKVLVQ